MRVDKSRRSFEENLGRLKESVNRELGWAPEGKGWWVAIVAFAAGLGLAARFRRGRSPSKEPDESLDGSSSALS